MSTQNLTYKFTLDTFKNGVQRVVQGLNTGEHVARKMEITLVSAGEAYEIPFNGIVANMYVKRPSQSTPSINPCSFDATRNKILYTLHDTDISEAGLVEMQLKLIDTRDDANVVMVAPKFSLEVWESQVSDSEAEDSADFGTLTDALAYLESAKGSMISEIYIDDNNVFTVEFADGTTYTSSFVADAVALMGDIEVNALKAEGFAVGKRAGTDVGSDSPYYHNNAKYFSEQASSNASTATASASSALTKATESESYAKGGTGTRTGEDTDNAKYYAELCLAIVQSLGGGGLVPVATITFSSLPTENLTAGLMYNISDAFTSDSRFKDGAGIQYGAGSNVYYTSDGKWDVLAGVSITINSKTGNSITLVASDIALTGYEKPNSTSAIATTDTIAQAIGKLEKALDGKVNTATGKMLTDNNYSNTDKSAVDALNGFTFGGWMSQSEFEAGQPYSDNKLRITYKETTP